MLNKYKQPDVLAALKDMYSDGNGGCFCCYCETPIVGSFPQIEHRKPKRGQRGHRGFRGFPQLALDWDNLHLACEICNNTKRGKWDADNEILDAVADVPISEHLGYTASSMGVYRKVQVGKPRGKTTVEHVGLNEKWLREARAQRLMEVWQLIDEIKELGDDPAALSKKQMLGDMCRGAYGSMVKYYAKRFCPGWDDECNGRP